MRKSSNTSRQSIARTYRSSMSFCLLRHKICSYPRYSAMCAGAMFLCIGSLAAVRRRLLYTTGRDSTGSSGHSPTRRKRPLKKTGVLRTVIMTRMTLTALRTTMVRHHSLAAAIYSRIESSTQPRSTSYLCRSTYCESRQGSP